MLDEAFYSLTPHALDYINEIADVNTSFEKYFQYLYNLRGSSPGYDDNTTTHFRYVL